MKTVKVPTKIKKYDSSGNEIFKQKIVKKKVNNPKTVPVLSDYERKEARIMRKKI